MSVLTVIRNLLPEGKLFRDVLTLAGGTAAAQLISISASPILTRLFPPADFGVLAVFASIIGILSVIVSWRYEFAIPIAETDEEAASLLTLSIALAGMTSIVVAVVAWIWRKQIARWVNTPELSSYIWLIPVTLLAIGIFQAANYWFTRRKDFTHISIAKVFQSTGQVCFQLVAGIMSLGAIGLIFGLVLGRFASASYLIFRLKIDLGMLSVQRIRLACSRYRKFPIYTAWASLINVVGTQAPVIMFAKLFSTEVTGLFALTIRILGLPAALIGQAVGQALYPRLAEKAKHSDTSSKIIGDAAIALFMVAFPLFVFVGAYGPTLFALVFGHDWWQAGLYARYLSPWLLLSFLSSPLSMFVYVREQQSIALVITVYETFVRIGSIWIGGMLGSPEWAIILYAAAGTLISGIYILWVFRLAQLSVYNWASQHSRYLITAGLVFVLILVVASVQSYLSVLAGAAVLFLHTWLWANHYRGVFRV